jgi:hypothetical protein
VSFERGVPGTVAYGAQEGETKPVFVEIPWHVNPMRGDAFEEAWLPVAGAALDYGATYWALLRSHEGRLDFLQHAIFPSQHDFELYWYAEQTAEVRARISGYYQVPLLPAFHEIAGAGVAAGKTPTPG